MLGKRDTVYEVVEVSSFTSPIKRINHSISKIMDETSQS
jgi:hypothetical protein